MQLKPCAVMFGPALLPDFEVWRAQRAQCRSCFHFQQQGSTMACLQSGDSRQGGREGKTCIGEREEGRACGPAGRLWKPRT